MKILLIHHPTVALKIFGFDHPDFDAFSESGIYLGNVYRKIIPPSLPRVASVIERYIPAEVEILDLRIADYRREEVYKTIDWEGYQIEARRVGAPFSIADEAISEADWLGLSSHFTFESGIIKDLIEYAKVVNPAIKVMVGGADAIARPRDYLEFGADLVFRGDFDPQALLDYERSHTGKRLPLAYGNDPGIIPPYRHPFNELIAPSFHKLPRLLDYSDSHDGAVPEGVPFPIGFIYFTRGCPRECDFCESRKTTYETLDLDLCLAMLEHYQKSGIRTLNLADDNLLIQAANKEGRARLLELLGAMKQMGFAWEYPNGLEMGRLIKGNSLDEELMEALFTHSINPVSGQIRGPYRLYFPVETFDNRGDYRKLKPLQEQNKVIEWIASSGIPELDFGVVLPPTADESTFLNTQEGYTNIKNIISSRGNSKARYAVFHLIPIALYRSMQTKYSVYDFPEGWNFYFPVYDGAHFTARELFEKRLRLVKEIDPINYENLMRGQYGYSSQNDLKILPEVGETHLPDRSYGETPTLAI